MFCPKCGSILLPKKEGNKKSLVCSCGHKGTPGEESKITESVAKKGADIAVIGDDKPNILPKTKAECEKCGNKEAYYWTVQTRAGDEPETKFLKCTKCNGISRDYD
jgi:transcription factor S